jgi:hypothetical protein
LHQKSSAQELAKVALQQENLSSQPAEPSRSLRKGFLQQNRSAEYMGRVALMQRDAALHQKNSAGLRDGCF